MSKRSWSEKGARLRDRAIGRGEVIRWGKSLLGRIEHAFVRGSGDCSAALCGFTPAVYAGWGRRRDRVQPSGLYGWCDRCAKEEKKLIKARAEARRVALEELAR